MPGTQSLPIPISCEGKDFATIREFANYYGLNYSKVQYYRKRGKTPEEIISACQFSTASKSESPKPSTKRYQCEYNGTEYSSLYEAANALGFNPAQLYELRKRKSLSPSAAIELAMQRRAEKGIGASPHASKCIIDGVEYESREAAIKAYGLPRVTVYSRMERDGISFEEALVKGRKAATYCPPTCSLFSSLHLVPAESVDQPTLNELSKALAYYKKKVVFQRDVLTLLPVLIVEDETTLFFNHDAHGLEIVSVLPIVLDLESLNIVNGAYANTKIYSSKMSAQTILSAFQSAKEDGQEIKSLIYAYFSFEAIRAQLIRNFGKSEVKQSLTRKSAAE